MQSIDYWEKNNKKLLAEHQPFKYITTWDFIIIFVAILFRLLVTMNQKSEDLALEGKEFSISKYLLRVIFILLIFNIKKGTIHNITGSNNDITGEAKLYIHITCIKYIILCI